MSRFYWLKKLKNQFEYPTQFWFENGLAIFRLPVRSATYAVNKTIKE